MRFIYYIVDVEKGTVAGTNSPEVVDMLLPDPQIILIHKDSGVAFNGSTVEIDIERHPEEADCDLEGEDDE